MQNRDLSLLQLRESVAFEVEQATEMEQFQGTVLRPLLKFQNEALLQIFQHYLTKRNLRFGQLSITDRLLTIENAVQKDQALRQLLTGTVVGQFTQIELSFYLENQAEINRRIGALLIKRLQDQLVKSS